MKKADLPTKNALEPVEGAHVPQSEELERKMPPHNEQNPSKKLTFAKNTAYNENTSQKSSSYKEVLSQPDKELSHRQRLQWLQKRRTAGLWVQCDDCERWRYLPTVLDRYELPHQWYCWMNSDKAYASCSVAEAPLRVHDEEDLIHSEYSAGSLVWASLTGWPWWPAMVDDCPDAEQFYWLDGFSDIPTHYNVVFFDTVDVTRAWIAPDRLKPYCTNAKAVKSALNNKTYQHRLKAAIAQADKAAKLSLPARLAEYSFISRHKGNVNSPRKFRKTDLKKYQKRFKTKFNMEIPIESSESDEDTETVSKNKAAKRQNVMVFGSVEYSKKNKKADMPNGGSDVIDLTKKQNDGITRTKEVVSQNLNNVIPPDSMVAQVGSTLETAVTQSVDNDSSKTYIPEMDKEKSSQIGEFTIRIETPNSDDFDF